MSNDIDTEIARLEQQIDTIKRRRLSSLQAELAKLTGGNAGTTSTAAAAPAADAPRKRGRKPGSKNKKTAAPKPAAKPAAKTGRRGGRKPQFSDDEAVSRLRKAVAAAGSEGISARGAGEAAGIFYPRAIKLMQDNFKKHGSGKWTRYTL